MPQVTQVSERFKYDVPLSDQNRNDSEEDDEKDSTEEELEKLVFGDTNAFKKNIKQYSAQDTGDTVLVEDDTGASTTKIENDLGLADDADVGLLDLYLSNSTY